MAEEALAIFMYCVLVAKTFKQDVVLVINRDGDSDSRGAITGNIPDAMLGTSDIQQRWLGLLELQ